MLEQGHNHLLIIASLAVALMAGFTGLSLTRGASGITLSQRKLVVSMSAVVLGSGIWSMHFVAMLGLRLSVEFYYDALTTLISALVAILITGIALLIVHFGTRTPGRITLAGTCLGLGIPAMHYIGMYGIQVAKPVYSVSGIVFAVLCSIALCILSFWISYGDRKDRNILYGTAAFGLSVFAVHFVAMAGTGFVESPNDGHTSLWIGNEGLALGVAISSFLISGAFLLAGVTFAAPGRNTDPADNLSPPAASHGVDETVKVETIKGRLPYEKEGKMHFLPEDEIAAVRAEGHYTFLYHKTGRLFCPLSISDVEKRIKSSEFFRCHRSYLVNAAFVTSFERKKDNGVCFFDSTTPLEKAPVSRSFLKAVREKLGA